MTSITKPRSWQATCLFLVLISLLSGSGCGGGISQDDLMRAAMRDTSSDEENENESGDASRVIADSQASHDGHAANGGGNDTVQASPSNANASQRPRSVNSTSQDVTDGSHSSTLLASQLSSDAETFAGSSTNEPLPMDQPLKDFTPAATIEERRERSIENMNEIAKGITSFADEKKYMPSPFIMDKNGDPGLSWRVSILPFLGYQSLYEQFRLDEAWDSEHNLQLVRQIPECFRDPGRGDEFTAYLLPVHRKTAFPEGNRPVRTARIEDGLANTVILVEVDEEAMVPWTKPADLRIDYSNPNLHLGGRYEDGFFAAWGSNRVVRIVPDVSPQILFGLFTVDGGEAFQRDVVSNEATSQVVGQAAEVASPTNADNASGTGVESGSRDVSSTNQGSTINSDRLAHSNSFTSTNNLALNQTELAYKSLQEGREYEAFQHRYVALLLTDPKEATRFFSWVPALERPVLALRWGIGLDALIPPQIKNDVAPIINPDRIERWKSGNPGEEDVQKYTGELGLRLLSMLRDRQDNGKYGTFANLASREDDPRDGSSVVRRNVATGEFDLERHYAGIHILGAGSRRVLTHVARRYSMDVLVIFDLELKATRYNQIHNTTTIHFINANTGEEIYESMSLNNIRVLSDREDRLKDDPVVEFFNRIQEVLDNELVTQDVPTISPEFARERIAEMESNPPENPLANFAEVHFYLGHGVISEFEYREACLKISQQEGATVLVDGSNYEKREFLEQWIDNGPED